MVANGYYCVARWLAKKFNMNLGSEFSDSSSSTPPQVIEMLGNFLMIKNVLTIKKVI
jgi:hypothetical protein